MSTWYPAKFLKGKSSRGPFCYYFSCFQTSSIDCATKPHLSAASWILSKKTAVRGGSLVQEKNTITFFQLTFRLHGLTSCRRAVRADKDCWSAYVAVALRAWMNARAPHDRHLKGLKVRNLTPHKFSMGNIRSAVKRIKGGNTRSGMLWSGDMG